MKNRKNKELTVKIQLQKGKSISELRFPDFDFIIYLNPPYSGSVRWEKSWKLSSKNIRYNKGYDARKIVARGKASK